MAGKKSRHKGRDKRKEERGKRKEEIGKGTGLKRICRSFNRHNDILLSRIYGTGITTGPGGL
jgi:hypothetical protein